MVWSTGPLRLGGEWTMSDQLTRMAELTRQECVDLLASVPLGRVVFTLRALPAVRPVNHIVDDGDIVFRSHTGAGIASAAGKRGEVVVAYEADMIDVEARTGWSVVVTGVARLVHDPTEIARLEQILRPWVDQPMDCVIRIHPELVTGYRILPAHAPISPLASR
jgi:hypothetical protein